LVISLLAGFVYGAAGAARAEAQTGMTDEQWWNPYALLLEQVMDSGLWPGRQRAGEADNAPSGPARAFEFGLQRV
jgi:hypothetical protein